MKKALSFLMAVIFAFGLLPSPALAFDAPRAALSDPGGVSSVVKTIILSKGESISLWNTDISSGGVSSNVISVLTMDDADYDMVFPEDEGTLAAISHRDTGLKSFNTSAYIRADASSNEGMLLRIKVNSGRVLLTVRSNGAGMSAEPISPYLDDGSLFERISADKDHTADLILPENCGLSNVTLLMHGTEGTQVRRVIDAQSNSYELYDFAHSMIKISSYQNGVKTDTNGIYYDACVAAENEIYSRVKLVIPKGAEYNNLGSMLTTNGSAFYLVPAFTLRDEAKRTEWLPNEPALDCYDDPAPYATFSSVINAQNGQYPFASSNDFSAAVEKYMKEKAEHIPDHELLPASAFLGLLSPGETMLSAPEFSWEQSEQSLFVLSNDALDSPETILPATIYDGSQENQTSFPHFLPDPDGEDYDYEIFVSGGSASAARGNLNDVVSLTPDAPPFGKVFAGWESNAPLDLGDGAEQSFRLEGEVKKIYISAKYEPVKYSVGVKTPLEGGSLTPDVTEAPAGEKVGFTASPAAGYALSSINALPAAEVVSDEERENGFTFTMPASAVTLDAVFEKLCYPVAAEASCGTLNADKQTATLGEKVTLTLNPQSESYRLASLSVRCGGENIETEKLGENKYAFTMPAGSVSASAVFVTDYFVSFENTDGAILAWQYLVSGQTPVYTGQTPEREPSVTSVFTFSGWDRPLEPVSGDEPFIKYTATYAPSPRSYEARFLGSKGETLQSATVKYGETPVYSGETPLKDADENYAYAFEKWSPEVSSATQDAVYTPVFRAFPLLREGINTFELEAYEQLDCLFTAEESGYYRFFTSGDDVGPEFIVTDGDKNDVSVKHFYVERGEQMSCERLVRLEEGETYAVSLTGYRAGEVSLHIRSVSVHTVRLDPNTPNGKVCGNEDVSFTAYSGELLTPYAEPDDGYGLFEMTVTDENGRRLMADRGSYLMPESDLFVTASFAPAREIKNDMNYGVSFINNDAVFADWSEEEETFVYRAAAGVGVEYKLLWEEGYIPDEIAVKTESGENVPFGAFLYGASETDLWFTMPDEPVTVTAKAAEASVLTLHSGLSDGGVARYAVKTGKEAALPACPFASPDGKAFSGWAETENGEPVYADKGAFTANADSALYAVWNDAPYIKAALSDGDAGKLCEITLYNMQSGVTLVLAEYENGRLLSARTRQTADAAEVFSLSASADKVKAFALEAVASAPLTGAVEVTVN